MLFEVRSEKEPVQEINITSADVDVHQVHPDAEKNDRPFQLEVLMTLGFISAVSNELEAVWDPLLLSTRPGKE